MQNSWSAEIHCVLQQGDSGFVIVRNGLITFRSPVLQHFFDCPLQFGAVPEHTNASDYAEDADLFELAVQVRPCKQYDGASLQLTDVHQLFAAWPVRKRLVDTSNESASYVICAAWGLDHRGIRRALGQCAGRRGAGLPFKQLTAGRTAGVLRSALLAWGTSGAV